MNLTAWPLGRNGRETSTLSQLSEPLRHCLGLRHNTQVSDGSQPPKTFDFFLSQAPGSPSLQCRLDTVGDPLVKTDNISP